LIQTQTRSHEAIFSLVDKSLKNTFDLTLKFNGEIKRHKFQSSGTLLNFHFPLKMKNMNMNLKNC